MAAIVVNGLTKKFAATEAVKDVSFSVEKGTLFGIIGPDGAGKSTLFRMLATLILPDAGRAVVDGYDVVSAYRSIRNTIGYMPGRFSLYQDLTVEENLHFFATLFGTTITANYELIKPIYQQIAPFKDRRAGKLSGGMKQKLALCCALIHRPTTLLLDEPTTGVDVVSRKEFWEMLQELKQHNITILVSTPYMDEADRCEQMALMHQGRLLAVDTPDGIRAGFREQLFAVAADEGVHRVLQVLRQLPDTGSATAFGETVHYTCKLKDKDIIIRLQEVLQAAQLSNVRITKIEPTIEDRFLQALSGFEQLPHPIDA